MSGKKFFRKLAIGFGVLMLFLAIDVAVAWYLNPKAETPVQAVRMEATHAAVEIIAKTMKAQLQKRDQALPSAAAPPAPASTTDQPSMQSDQPQAQPEQPEQQSDKDTYLDDIEAEDNILVYTITVKASGDVFDYVMRKMHADHFPYDCTKPEYERLLEYGVGVMLDFRSQDGTKQDSITFTPETCGYERIEQSQQKPAQQPQSPQPSDRQPEPQQTQQQQQQQQPPQPQQPQAGQSTQPSQPGTPLQQQAPAEPPQPPAQQAQPPQIEVPPRLQQPEQLIELPQPKPLQQ